MTRICTERGLSLRFAAAVGAALALLTVLPQPLRAEERDALVRRAGADPAARRADPRASTAAPTARRPRSKRHAASSRAIRTRSASRRSTPHRADRRALDAQMLERLDAQSRLLAQQAARIEDQERRLREQESALRRAEPRFEALRVHEDDPAAPLTPWRHVEGDGLAEYSGKGSDDASPAREVLELDPGLLRRGGALTSKGIVVVEPTVDWSTSRLSRFAFEGLGVQNTVFFGQIEATESTRSALVSGLGVRVGLRDRLEIDARIPMVRRTDSFTSQIVSEDQPSLLERSRDGAGLGDVELGVHYQLNEPTDDDPIHVANLRLTLPTGKGPFDVSRDALGFERELATGAGHFSIEPSWSVIVPSDPTVLFANVSYQLNLPFDADTTFNTGSGNVRVGRVDPGDAIGASFGIGVALNERTSLRLGYDHQYVLPTRSRIDGASFDSESLHVGVLELGITHRTRRGLSLIFTFGIGVTDAAPDIRIGLRVPTSFEMF